jgi:DNA polymerase-3 subunit beta
MKVSVLQEKLAHGLNVVSRAVSSRSTLPVLGNVLVATDEGRLRLSATDLELSITCWIGSKIAEEGSTTVPSRIFSDFVSTLSKDHIELDLEERTQTLNLRSGTSNTDIKCVDAQEFPPMETPDLADGIQLQVGDLKEMIAQVVFAASTDEARPVLTGVLVTIEGPKITMATADGFRLSVRDAELAANTANAKAVIPARALKELSRVATNNDDLITMVLLPNRGQVVFRLKDVELSSRLINDEFPDYRQVIPQKFKTRTIVSTANLLKAVRQAEIFARDGSNIARLNIVPGEGNDSGMIEMSAQSEEAGRNETVVDANVEGPGILIAFNVRYLRDVLEVVKTPNVALETSVSASPGLFRPLGDQTFLHVIMPMHI